ncbi:MAG: hypothetical protein UV78_C0022G0018 [Parcubacteria group bacterium GW2011_GWA2_43_17]|nr:MAG: hypothetical protein UV78_C0022G0018 [Parcubacteria group bacterium GW2011_GWA2_43_17]KKT92554.1 MAG: hypothetical protein UW91_C0019G0008 [Parcubacteria group bacterium GW2011_GWF2_45_11]KKT97179.1 MAG: hypothetical protein UW98_C0022G0020 [Parcubacteria group bacterium GW2011_GWC2_45_15]
MLRFYHEANIMLSRWINQKAAFYREWHGLPNSEERDFLPDRQKSYIIQPL